MFWVGWWISSQLRPRCWKESAQARRYPPKICASREHLKPQASRGLEHRVWLGQDCLTRRACETPICFRRWTRAVRKAYPAKHEASIRTSALAGVRRMRSGRRTHGTGDPILHGEPAVYGVGAGGQGRAGAAEQGVRIGKPGVGCAESAGD